MGRLTRTLILLTSLVLIPTLAHAQASLAGVVRDASGGVLPGVTVEAASEVLIEKVRTGVTDGVGRYQIIDLRPGVYTVTFTLTGFATVRRETVELTGTAVTTVNIDMRVGGVQETITVSGDTPTVDLQTATRQTVMDQEIVTAVPTSRNSFAVGVLIPGVTVTNGFGPQQDVGGSLGPTTLALMAHGSRLSDQRLMVNGVSLSTMIGGGWGGGAVPNATGTAEFAIDTSGVDASLATGGVRTNFIPRDGGNRFSGTVFGSYATEGFASDNFDAELAARGLPVPGQIKVNGDFNPGFGGPIKRDKVWFFLSGRYQIADLYTPGMFHNKNANNPNAWTYEPDLTRQATSPREFDVYQARFTWQANPKNKFGLTYDWESNCFCPDNVSATRTPEAGTDRRFPLQRFIQVDWNSPVSSRLLVEASVIHRVERWGGMHLQTGSGDNITGLDPRMIGVVDVALAPPPGFTYRAAAQGLAPGSPPYNNSWNKNLHYRGAVSYITGSHAFKVGFNNAWGYHDNQAYSLNPLFYTFAAGVPVSLTIQAAPYTTKVEVDRDLGIFAQDKWTTGRWTLSGGIRYDHFKNSFPEQSLEPSFFTPNRSVDFPRIDNISWHDITPKLAATYDLFGNGKTALKTTLNKYLLGYGTFAFGENGLSSDPNPIFRLANNATRTWVDADHDFVPDCNLQNFGENGECGALDNPNFGTIIPGTTYDPDLLEGWGKRQFNWEFSAGVQHELMPRVSVDVFYFRRWYGNFQTMDDRSLSPADYDRFSFLAPVDSRLPNGGGYTVTAVDLRFPQVFGAPDNFVTLANNYGKQTEHWNGVDFAANARLQNGLILQGGVSTGRLVRDDCEIVEALPERLHDFLGSNTRLFFFPARPLSECHRDDGFLTQMKALASYVFPKIDVQLSATYQSYPGPVLDVNYNSFGTGTLGRPFGFGPFRAFEIVNQGDLIGDRLNQVDFRVAKIFRFGTTRTQLNFDLYNLFNSNAVLTENAQYESWNPNQNIGRTPTSILQARFFKIGAQFDF
jgi:hypothetical protein